MDKLHIPPLYLSVDALILVVDFQTELMRLMIVHLLSHIDEVFDLLRFSDPSHLQQLCFLLL